MALDIPNIDPNDYEGPFAKAYRSSNSLQNDILARRMNEIKAFYEEPRLRSEIGSKNAYSRYIGPQMLAHVLGGPAAAQMTPAQYNQYVSQMANMLNQSPEQGLPTSMPQPIGNRMLNALFNKISPQQVQPQLEQGNSLKQMSEELPSQSNAMAQNVRTRTAPSTVFPSLANRQAQLDYAYGKKNAPEPANDLGTNNQPQTMSQLLIQQKNQEQAKLRQENLRNETYIKEWSERNKENAQNLKISDERSGDLDILEENYPNVLAFEKGPIFGGKVKPISEAGIASTEAVSRLMKSAAKALSTKRITAAQLSLAQSLIPAMNKSSAGMQKAINYFRGVDIRSNERAPFDALAQRNGFKPHEADLMWLRYINEKPFYDPKTGKIIEKNMGNYDDYINEDALEKSLHYKQKVPEERILKQEAEKLSKYQKSKPEKVFDLTRFKNEKEFNDWYKNLDKGSKQQVRKQIESEVY